MSIVCPNVWYTRLLLSFYGVGKEFLLLGSGEELCINSSILPAVIGWNGEDFYSSLEYNSEIFWVFDGFGGRICASREEIWISSFILPELGCHWQLASPLVEGNSSPEFFLEKLFPDIYPLKCKYIYP